MTVSKFYPTPFDPHLRGQKSNILISQLLRQLLIFLAEILPAGRAAIDMKHIERDFSLKACVPVRWMDLGGGAEAKIKLFQNTVMLHIKLKLTTLANFLPTGTPSTQGVGSKGQIISFSESSHVAYQIKGN